MNRVIQQWVKIKKSPIPIHMVLFWIFFAILIVIGFLLIPAQSTVSSAANAESPKWTGSENYRLALKNNLAYLQVPTKLDNASNMKKTKMASRFDKKIDKTYLARLNAPTRMYAASSDKNANKEMMDVSAEKINHPEYTLVAGELIPAILETAVNSELPGMTRAIVSAPVYAYIGRRIMIPKGSRLIGQYSAAVAQSQNRLLIIWNRIILPNGISVRLDSASADDLGRVGMGADQVDNHFMARFGEAALLSLLGAGSATAGVSGDDQYNSLAQYRNALAESFQQSAQQSLQESLPIKPTLHIHQGTAIKVFVAKDLSFYNVRVKIDS